MGVTTPFVVTLATSLAIGVPALEAAEPAEGQIEWGGSVEWSGGPLTGLDHAQRSIGECGPPACDEFLLDVQVEPSPDPNRNRFVSITFEKSHGAAKRSSAPETEGGKVREDAVFLLDDHLRCVRRHRCLQRGSRGG